MNDLSNSPTVDGSIAPPASLTALMAELADAKIKIDRFQIFNTRLAAATSQLEQAEAALGSFRAAEADALARWAETGSGQPPARDDEAYGRLKIERERAIRERDDAESASRAIAPSNLRAILAANEIQEKIETKLAESVADEAGRLARELDQDLENLQGRLARILAARHALANRSETIDRSKRPELAAALARLARNLDFPLKLEISPTQGEVFRAAAEWTAKLQPPESA